MASSMLKTLFSIVIVLSVSFLHAQDTITIKKRPKSRFADTLFIRQYPDYITLGAFAATPYMTMSMSPLVDSLSKFGSSFEGNYSGTLGFSFGYRAVGFSYGFKVPLDPLSIDQMGKSSFRVLSIKIKKLPFIISLDYRKYRGFYDANTKSYDTTVTEQKPYYVRPDMSFKSYSGSMIVNFSWRKFSYTAPINYGDRQVKTRFGFLLKGAVSYIQLYSDSSFVTKLQGSAFPEFNQVKGIDAMIIKSGPGVGMNLVMFKRLYLSMALFFMGNNSLYRYTDESNKMNGWRYNVNYFFEGALALGFNSKRFYTGVRIGGDNNVMRIKGAKVQSSFGSFSFDMGFRLNTPGFFRKTWNKTLTRYLRL